MHELTGGSEENDAVDLCAHDSVQIVEERGWIHFDRVGHPRRSNRRVDSAGRNYLLTFPPAHISANAQNARFCRLRIVLWCDPCLWARGTSGRARSRTYVAAWLS